MAYAITALCIVVAIVVAAIVLRPEPNQDIGKILKDREEAAEAMGKKLEELKKSFEDLKAGTDVKQAAAAKLYADAKAELAKVPELQMRISTMAPSEINEELKKRGFKVEDF